MKRCPECRRDYYDDTLLYCLDDGTALLEGPVSPSERKTALLPDGVMPSEADTKALPSNNVGRKTKALFSTRKWLLAAVCLALGALLAGFLLYRQWAGGPQPQETRIRSLAVLPLRSLDSRDDTLGFGIADAIIRRISQTGQILVRPTSSVRRYLSEETDAISAAKQLKTDAVLEGTVQRSNDRLRVTVNLLRSSDGLSLWSDSFDMKMGDIFTIQDMVAQQLVSKLRLQLDPQQRVRLAKRSAVDPTAYEFYVKGVYAYEQSSSQDSASPAQLDAAINNFKRAIEIEPDYALAHAVLAGAYINKAIFFAVDQQQELADLARAEMTRADDLDPELPETHLARSFLLWSNYGGAQTEAAARETLLAQKLDPNVGHVGLAGIYYHWGLEDEAAKEYQKAFEIDPTSEGTKNEVLFFYSTTGRWDEYLQAVKSYFPERSVLPQYYVAKGDLKEAEKALERLKSDRPTNTEIGARALIAAHRKDVNEAEAQVALWLKTVSPLNQSFHHDAYDIASVYAILGKKDDAIKWLKDSVAAGYTNYPHLERDPYFDGIRNSTEFRQLTESLKPKFEARKQEFGYGR